jgi:hypothetical protein
MISTQVLDRRKIITRFDEYRDFNIDNFSVGHTISGDQLVLQNIKLVISVLKYEILMNYPGIGSNVLFKIGSLITSKVLEGFEPLEQDLYSEIERQVSNVTVDREKSTLDIYADNNAISISIYCVINNKSYIVEDTVAF